MGDPSSPPDINVSNGTCYYTEHMQTKGNFIACGNVAFGHWPCCQAGDMCLSLGNANACWDSDTGNTYLAGCTDAGFNARACPWKSLLFHEQEWVAIQQCHPGTGSEDTIWGGCKVDANQTTLEKLPHASCDPYCSSTLLQGASALPAFASLPSSAGEPSSGRAATSAGVKPANATATPMGSSTMPSISPPSASTTAPPIPTATSSSSAAATTSPDDSSLTVGAKAGIGVGAAGAALLIVAVVLLALLVRRRKQKRNSQNILEETPSSHPQQYIGPAVQQYQQEQAIYYNKTSQQLPPPSTTTVKPMLNSQDSHPYVGYKAELSADETQQRRPWDQQTGYKSELAADETTMPPNEIGSSGGGHDEIAGAKSWSRAGGGSHREGSGAHATPGGSGSGGGSGGGGGLSPYPSPHPSSAATAHSPFSTHSDVSTLYASSGSGGGTGRWALPPPTPPQPPHQPRAGDSLGQEWPLPNGPSPAQWQSFRERQQGRGASRSNGYDPV
ncbi:hypothetical protein PG999_002771 [Apiospora kogelbergensis]|uniref:Uncharacterized protein n=1 Tax=Apiospora kogelbergensis TaxID=1337665 RepID=A0AAW0R9B4_9PEZI